MRTIATLPAALPFTSTTLADIRSELAEAWEPTYCPEEDDGEDRERAWDQYEASMSLVDRDLDILSVYLEETAA